MPRNSLSTVLQKVRKLAAVQTSRALSDRELLERFINENDEAAFTAMVERFGPMVHGVCYRVLHNTHDADDACQATFLVLVQKARSLRKMTSLGSWLHGIACRVSANLQRENARRRKRERSAERPEPANGMHEITWHNLQPILDDELQKLPERYRPPLILCYLDGKTRDEAAEQLGISAGRLHGLLERGRHLLRERLVQRGVTLSAALFGAALAEGASHAALSPTFVVSSTRAALLLAAGQPLPESIVAAKVLSLTQGVLNTMFLTKVKICTAAALGVGFLVASIAGVWTGQGIAQDAKPPAFKLEFGAGKIIIVGQKPESDEVFLRRISKDLRGSEPTPAEIHFFTTSKEPGKRQKAIDLFIQERQAKQAAKKAGGIQFEMVVEGMDFLIVGDKKGTLQLSPGILQKELFKNLQGAKDKGDVQKITQKYLDRLLQYAKDNPTSSDIREAVAQIVLVYESQGKTAEAAAWREKLKKEQPKAK